MSVKLISILLFFLAISLLFAAAPAAACDPVKGDLLGCPATPSAVSSGALGQGAASAPSPGTAKTIGVESNATAFSLPCLLPDGDESSNALGVAGSCTSIPVQVRAVKVLPTPVPTKVSVAAAAPQPKGDSPFTAMPVTGATYTLEPGRVHWYKIDNGNNFFLNVWLEAGGRGGITLALYAPEQANGLSVDTQPKGRGAPVKNEPTVDLLWKGSYATGVWHALVRNYDPFPVQYKLGTQQSTTERNCISYWEWLPTGAYVLWTDCGHYTDTSKK
jgi:hypothetical protein